MRRIFATFSLFAATLPAVPLPDLLPEDASLVIIAHNVPELIERLQDSPWARTWNDDHVKKFLAPLREKLRDDDWENIIRANTGLPPDALKKLVQGGILFALPAVSAENTEPEPLLAIELGSNAPLVENLIATALALADTTATTETYSGVTINTVDFDGPKNPFKTISWAIAGGKLLASPSRDALPPLIDALQHNGPERPFGKTTRYLDLRARSNDDPGLLVHLNLQTGPFAAIRKTWADAARLGKTPPITPDDYVALGLDTIESVSASITFAPGATHIEAHVAHGDKRGVLDLAAFGDTPLEIPPFASADWPVLYVSNYDIPAGLAALENFAAIYYPGIHSLYTIRLEDAIATHSINIKRDLIGSVGGQVIAATVIPPATPPDAPNIAQLAGTVYVFELRDPRTFQNTLAAIIRATGLENSPAFSKRDYLGATIHTLNNPRNPLGIAVAKNQFVLARGVPAIIESVVQNIINGATNPAADAPGIRAAFDTAPPDIRYFTAQDMRFTLHHLAAILPLFPGTRDFIARDAIPSPAVFEKYWDNFHTWLTETSGNIRVTTEIPYKK